MAIRIAAHLCCNRFNVFYYRRVVPLDLRRFLGQAEIYRSLGTSSRRDAIAWSRPLAVCVDSLFSELRSMAKKDPDKSLSLDYSVFLEFDEAGKPKNVKLTAEPHEAEAANQSVTQIFSALFEVDEGKRRATISKASVAFFDAVEKYLHELKQSGTVGDSGLTDYRGDFDQLIWVSGNPTIDAMDKAFMVGLKDKLMRLPANIRKRPDLRGKLVDEVLALDLPTQSPTTVRKKWTRLTSFFEWTFAHGYAETNPAKGMKPRATAKSYEKFTQNDLRALFDTVEYRDGLFREAFQYWVPVIGLYSGARIEEICQLQLADVKHADGIPYFNFTAEIDEDQGDQDSPKRVKNESSNRLCPVHSEFVATWAMA